jgi:CheY-like chemotaxis protein
MEPRVLVVEDEPVIRLLLGRYLARMGYQAEGVHSAEGALDLLTNGTEFAAFVIDVTLPGMSGVELARRIVERYPAARIVLTSGYAYGPELLDAADGRVTFLRKPFQPAQLVAALTGRLAESLR